MPVEAYILVVWPFFWEGLKNSFLTFFPEAEKQLIDLGKLQGPTRRVATPNGGFRLGNPTPKSPTNSDVGIIYSNLPRYISTTTNETEIFWYNFSP